MMRFVGNAKILLTQNHALGDPGSAMAKHYGNALTLWPQLWDHAREWASARR